MTILVTGGAGFIGSHVVEALLETGHSVHVLDDLSSGHRANVPEGVPLHVHDVRSSEAARLVAEHEYDALVHHAAQIDVRRSVQEPAFDADVNIRGFLNLVEAGRSHGLEKVVFASTGGALYGEPDYTPQDESHPLRPVSPYGVAKRATETYLDYYRRQHDLDVVALRYANVYGPRQDPDGEAGVVAIFTEQLLSGTEPTIYGDGEQTRDYVYVDDVVRANRASLNYEGSGVFNVGTGKETSVNELFRRLRAEVGADVDAVRAPPRSGEQRRSVLDVEKAQAELGWTPKVSVEDGLARTVEWFRARRDGQTA